ncbi:hypothetical protein GE061_008236 [Apolygus lucorum]|uniref:Cyclin-dependent kinases regulatory subunit n=1 Tax=Apolygus lucorum TaxID=248454 RepID=A0A8S9WQT2_APOLU|nr:hypothetical protein GE061_008236 [Apolygus lucorum]
MQGEEIHYSERYEDAQFEYRHVMLPSAISKLVPKNHMMTETEWRNLSIQQSNGWVHYMTHNREQHVLCFRRPKQKDALREIDSNLLSNN